MFIKLHWVTTNDTEVFNTDHIIRFGRGSGWTWVVTSDGKEHNMIKEAPNEILAMLARGSDI